jgi:hypothetical protein
LDSTVITLPVERRDPLSGCGGTHGGQAALRPHAEFDLRIGSLTHLQLESGCNFDCATSRPQARRGPGSSRVSKLGYFIAAEFAAMSAAAV